MSKLTIVIPNRNNETPDITINSLIKQTFRDFNVVIVNDVENKGANWARNEGFKKCDTELVLFSDNDINWYENALETMVKTLDEHQDKSYVYCSYEMNGDIQCNRPFNADDLKFFNYISTMSIIRSKDFTGFDENIQRLQDWDLWLSMLYQGKTGVWCGETLFSTKEKDGITKNGVISYEEAENIIHKKYEDINSSTPR